MDDEQHCDILPTTILINVFNQLSNHYHSLLEEIKGNDYNVLHTGEGDLLADRAFEFSQKVEEVLTDLGEKRTVIRKLFNTIVEAYQNIRRHGHAIDGKVYGAIIVSQNDSCYEVIVMNFITNEGIEKISKDINTINAMDRVALKQYYLERLDKGEISSKGGAGLGLITMALKSDYKIKGDFLTVGEGVSLFVLSYKIDSRIEK